ncbi:MAG: superoxide dismutase [Anaerolineales bacterium]|nr:superoxide dismutase [Anaerolineales bacterium]
MTHKLPALPYAHEALEPHIDGRTMEIHHSKHHNAYVTNLNNALDQYADLHSKSLVDLMKDLTTVPSSIRTAVRNNGGGHLNHSMFWTSMSPNGGGAPSGELAAAIDGTFGNFEGLKDEFSKAAATRFGSGWAWLSVNTNSNLVVSSTANQDNPVSEGMTPLLGLDVWEHAYYLNYKNLRPDYVSAWWNVVNWDEVSARLTAA